MSRESNIEQLKRYENEPLFLGGKATSHRVTRADGATEDFLTGGYGHLLDEEESKLYPEGTEIPQSEVDRWFDTIDYPKAEKAAKQQAKDFNIERLTDALVSVNYQLGTKWHQKFPAAVKALREGRNEDAAREVMLGNDGVTPSIWAQQTPVRATAFSDAILSVPKKKV